MANFPIVIETPCIPTVPPPPDPNCSDPAFAAQHPELCGTTSTLRIKPEILFACILGSVQFKAFLVTAGQETELTSGVLWTTNDPTIALVGASSGNATGVAAGLATITATYQGISANARLTVLPGLNCCEENGIATMLVVDRSHSMAQEFGGAYLTKQNFANALAAGYADQTNTEKDQIGLIAFGDSAETLEALTSDKAAVVAAANAIIVTNDKTDLQEAVGSAAEALLASALPIKVMVVISDGVENESLTTANSPATSFKNAGGIIIAVGVRAITTGFNLLNAIATGGFFVNAYPTVVDEAIQTVYGLKGYVCGGQCVPAGDQYQNEPQLDYTAFINWTVTNGHVDLLGPGLFDLLPGNGLYVSLVSNMSPQAGELTTISSFTFEAGKTYRIKFSLAGNQRQDLGQQTVVVKVGDGTAFMQVIGMPNYAAGFADFSFNFSPLVTVTAPLIISETGNTIFGNYFGCLLDNVAIDDVTDSTSMFTDNFDSENLVFVPPACGPSIVQPGYYGYACYGYGCLDQPPGIQVEDPNPQPDTEAGFVPPVTYTATVSYTANCPPGSTPVNPDTVVPVMTSATAPSGVVTVSSEQVGYDGWRAFGTGPSWRGNSPGNLQNLKYQFPLAKTLVEFAITPGALINGIACLVEFLGSNDDISYTSLFSQSGVIFQTGERQLFEIIPNNWGAYTYYALRIFPQLAPTANPEITLLQYYEAGTIGVGVTRTETRTSTISQANANALALVAAQTAALEALAETGCLAFYTSTQSATVQCPAGQFGPVITRSATANSFVSQADADAQAYAAALALAQAALDCTQSNNTQAIDIPDFQVAVPYPSVSFKSGIAGAITRIRVNLIGYHHQNEGDVAMLLVSPSGKYVSLMWQCGGGFALPPTNITFDSDPQPNLPAAGVFAAGSYAPTQFGLTPNFPAPAPAGPYLTDFSTLIGDDPNGAWSLWVQDHVVLDVGAIDGGWTLVLDTA